MKASEREKASADAFRQVDAFQQGFMMNFSQKVLQLTGKIPKGKVTTYSEIARALGKPKASRAVGNALAGNGKPDIIPCYRVVHSDGSVRGYSGSGGTKEKIRRLESDGIVIRKGKVEMERHLHSFGK